MKLRKKQIFICFFILLFLFVLILFLTLNKVHISNLRKNDSNEFIKKQIETEIQGFIDEVINKIEEAEQRQATLTDLKSSLQERTYFLNETTGELYYNDYIVIINPDLTISDIKLIETLVNYKIIKDNGDSYSLLITVENEKGIEKITTGDITISCNEKQKVAIDEKVLKNSEHIIEVKLKDDILTEKFAIAPIVTGKMVEISNFDTFGDGKTKTIKVNSVETENLVTCYSLDDGQTWKIYSEEFDVLEESNFTISANVFSQVGKIITNTADNSNNISVAVSSSLISAVENAVMEKDEYYRIAVKDMEYTVHMYVEDGDTILESNTTYGDANDVATSSAYAKNMVIVKVKGDLTINQGVTVSAARSNSGYGGPKGLLLYCTGTLTNNGTISMTAGGAKALGEDVYLWQNTDGSYEYIPKTGGLGGASGRTGVESGIPGTDGVNRQTGGGGSGGAHGNSCTVYSGAGSAGTSYSGGTGGGAVCRYAVNGNATAGAANGGTGGSGSAAQTSGYTKNAGGGAGNPGGRGVQAGSKAGTAQNGSNGTGGLLIVVSNNFINNSLIVSNGSNGGDATCSTDTNYNYRTWGAAGGSSGGGSINLFTNTLENNGTIQANGGISVQSNSHGGAGGKGSITIGSIETGTFVEQVD